MTERDMPHRSETACPADGESPLAVRYLKGELPPEDAERFEKHYFGCETCWEEVQGVLEIRAAMRHDPSLLQTGQAVPSQATRDGSASRARRRRVSWRPVAVAAVLVLATASLWRYLEDRERSPSSTVRAQQITLAVSAYTSGDALIATWQRVPDVHVYHVRLFAEDGELLLERDIPDTTIVVETSAVTRALPGRPLYWDVEGLNELRHVVARSGLRRVEAPARGAR